MAEQRIICHKCGKFFSTRQYVAYCPACHAEVKNGNYFNRMNSERPAAGPQKPECLQVHGSQARLYNYRTQGLRGLLRRLPFVRLFRS